MRVYVISSAGVVVGATSSRKLAIASCEGFVTALNDGPPEWSTQAKHTGTCKNRAASVNYEMMFVNSVNIQKAVAKYGARN